MYVGGTFKMTGGVIHDCKAGEGSDGVSIETDAAKFNADGGTVRDNVNLARGTLTQSANAKNATVFYGELSKNVGTISGKTVTFMTDEETQYAWEVVVDGKKAVAPDEPQPKEGWTFGGWYTDAACTMVYDFNQTVTSDLDLYAKWDAQADELEQIDGLAWLTPVLGALDREPFDDVTTRDWFYDAVRYVNEYGLMTGTGYRTFSPDAPVTRGMVMTILARREGIRTDRYSPWYAAGVEWAVANGISDGTNPEAAITREELATMLYRYASLKGYDPSGAALTGFTDASSVSSYAAPAMQWAIGAGLISGAAGVDAGKLLPQQTATRAQLAAILHRFIG